MKQKRNLVKIGKMYIKKLKEQNNFKDSYLVDYKNSSLQMKMKWKEYKCLTLNQLKNILTENIWLKLMKYFMKFGTQKK